MVRFVRKEKPPPHPIERMAMRAKLRGIHQAELIRKVIEEKVTSVTERTLQNWMNGKTRPDIGQWRLIEPVLRKAVGK